MTAPYWEGDGITLYRGDCLDMLDVLDRADVMVTDPPYGIAYNSGSRRDTLAASIVGDEDTMARDRILARWRGKPSLMFGTWRIPRPEGVHTRLIWDTKGALGMGNLSVPWKPSDQEIYVIGYGFQGPRTTNVLRYAPVQSTAKGGRQHPHQKPVPLMEKLLEKCPPEWVIVDPFAGSGSTLVAARNLGRRAIGVEIETKYCDLIVGRLSQGVLQL